MFEVIDRPKFINPSVEIRNKKTQGIVFTVPKEELRTKSPQDIYDRITNWAPCVWRYYPDDKTRAALLVAIYQAKLLALAEK